MNQSTTHTAAIPLPPVPACPSWCEAHDAQDRSWDVTPHATTRRCSLTLRAAAIDVDSEIWIDIKLDRFADIDGGLVTVRAPEIRIDDRDPGEALPLALAAALAHKLLAATALLQADQNALETALETMRQLGYDSGYQDGAEAARMTA